MKRSRGRPRKGRPINWRNFLFYKMLHLVPKLPEDRRPKWSNETLAPLLKAHLYEIRVITGRKVRPDRQTPNIYFTINKIPDNWKQGDAWSQKHHDELYNISTSLQADCLNLFKATNSASPGKFIDTVLTSINKNLSTAPRPEIIYFDPKWEFQLKLPDYDIRVLSYESFQYFLLKSHGLWKIFLPCRLCGRPLLPLRADHVYCSDYCQKEGFRKK